MIFVPVRPPGGQRIVPAKALERPPVLNEKAVLLLLNLVPLRSFVERKRAFAGTIRCQPGGRTVTIILDRQKILLSENEKMKYNRW